jgi:hypothetical protein
MFESCRAHADAVRGSQCSARLRSVRRCRDHWLRRLVRFVRLERTLGRYGDFFIDEPPPDSFVREPRRPKPFSPSSTAMLELPDTDAA